MSYPISSCGLRVVIDTDAPFWQAVAGQAFGGDTRPIGSPDVRVVIDSSTALFPMPSVLTRGAAVDGSSVVLEDACGSGLDLRLTPQGDRLDVIARVHRGWRHRALGLAAPARTTLLWRAALFQYPLLWWAGVRSAVPAHVSAAVVGGRGVVLAGPGGVGKSTLVASLTGADLPTCDNLAVLDRRTLHGLLEPRRVTAKDTAKATASASRRAPLMPRVPRMPHGRVETRWDRRIDAIDADLVLVLRRGSAPEATARAIDPTAAARVLTAGTYAAGELRRYWAFAATLALGTGLGPAHPPVTQASTRLAEAVRCVEVTLPGQPGVPLRHLVDLAGVATGDTGAGDFATATDRTGVPR